MVFNISEHILRIDRLGQLVVAVATPIPCAVSRQLQDWMRACTGSTTLLNVSVYYEERPGIEKARPINSAWMRGSRAGYLWLQQVHLHICATNDSIEASSSIFKKWSSETKSSNFQFPVLVFVASEVVVLRLRRC